MVNVATLIAILLAAALAIYSVSLLIVGIPGISVEENAPGAPPASPQLVYLPYPTARMSLMASLLVIGGLLGGMWRRGLLLVAWIGIALLLIFGVLLIFSIGIALLLVAAPLLVLLTVVTFKG